MVFHWLSQLSLLLWKNYILQIRRPIGTVVELLLPFCLTCLLLIGRVLVDPEDKCFTTFDPGFDDGLNGAYNLAASGAIREECIANLTGCPRLVYYPRNNVTDYVFDTLGSLLSFDPTIASFLNISDESFASEEEMASMLAEDPQSYYGAVVFDIEDNATTFPQDLSYRIRLHHEILLPDQTWNTRRTYPAFQDLGPRTSNDYKTRFLLLQYLVDLAVASYQTVGNFGSNSARLLNVSVELQQYPYPKYLQDDFITSIQFLLPFLLCISFIYSAGIICKELVLEKELRLKESMKMMGLANWIHWMAWFIKSLLFLLIPTLLIIALLKIGNIFENTDTSFLIVFFILWLFAAITWNFVISTIFSRATLGMIFGMVLWYVNYIPAGFLDIDTSPRPVLLLLCLLPNSCLTFAVEIIARYESKSIGVQWSNVFTSPSVDGSFTMGECMIMCAVDFVLFFLITIYIEAVFPGKYGIPRPFYFPFQPSYWCGPRVSARAVTPKNGDMEMNETITQNNEEEPQDLEQGIHITNLTKVYKSAVGKKMAVDNLSLNMYKGQITALLGHNGAGKTTTMSILTGLFPPTSGCATVNGHDIIRDIGGVRKSLGLCPQHNVLFDRLTVKEHLDFFISLKGKRGKEAKQEVNQMIEDLYLVDKTHSQSSKLSGGMKRKLCCAVALIGGSEIVILDEPTSGMDPYARRATWDLLLKYKAGKTILLTTHFMDEADLLGDRIAIMADGRLVCSGSSLFLKNRFGVGYHLTMVPSSDCDVPAVTDFVRNRIPDAFLQSNIGSEMDFILPLDQTSKFKDLFTMLEEKRTALGISSFGVSVTTLEEVFVKVGILAEGEEVVGHSNAGLEMETEANGHAKMETAANGHAKMETEVLPKDHSNKDISVKVDAAAMSVPAEEYITGLRLKFQQYIAMFQKRLICALRDRKSWILQILLPLVFVSLGLLVAKTGTRLDADPPRELSLSNLSRVATDGMVKAYVADLRVQTSGIPDPFQYLPAHLAEMNVEVIDITEYVWKLWEDNQGLLVEGTAITEDVNCCDYTNQILNQECAEIFALDMEDICKDEPEFGYHNCKDCLSDYLNNGTSSTSCPTAANYTDLTDVSNYFSEYVLRESDSDFFFQEYVAGFMLRDDPVPPFGKNRMIATGWYSNQAYHTSAEVLNAMNNALLKWFTNESYAIKTTNYPLPLSTSSAASNSGADPDTFSLTLLVLFGLSFLTGSFIPYIVSEKSCKAKHLQLVSGLDRMTYWLANFSWDFINYIIVYIIILAVFAIFQVPAFSGANMGSVAVMLLLFGFAAIPFVYLISTLFTTAVIGYSVSVAVLSIVGMGFTITVFILEVLDGNENTANILDHIFMLLPTYAMSRSLFLIATNHAIRDACTATDIQMTICEQANVTYFDNNYNWERPGIGQILLYLSLEGVVFFIAVIVFEYGFFTFLCSSKSVHVRRNEYEDSDVAAERTSISTMNPKDEKNAVFIKNLSKVYFGAHEPAVDHLCLAIPNGECFGLLGVNGAGKTTTFGILTGDLLMSSGNAYIQGHNIKTHRRQFDALVERLTGRELLTMFAKLRGIPSKYISALVDATIEHLDLVQYGDKLCGNYSGGNKRKLSTAIALVGSPPVILLDEPTSGMDPRARRHLWNAIIRVIKEGRSVVLTSHSMEECEALCTRLAIMVNGQFKCLGSTQHLKSKFGKGYTMVIKTSAVNGTDEALKAFVLDRFPGASLIEEHQGTVHYQVVNDAMKWSQIFGALEENKETLGILDYSVSQTPLEQVFINFAKQQNPELRKRCCCCCC